jgi:putative ABC transport system ATP-binding protein
LRRRRVGMVFQSFGLVPSLSAGENVALPLALEKVSDEEREQRSRAALRNVDLEHAYYARIDELSGGQRQRVGVARAIVAQPALVLADEPTGSLDDDTGDLVLDLLVDAVRRRGASLVLVTHDPRSAARADHRWQMHDGRLAVVA